MRRKEFKPLDEDAGFDDIPEATVPDIPAETAEEWLEKNAPRDVAYFSARARSGVDPAFTTEFMKQTMSYLTAKAKARIDGTAQVLASDSGDRKMLEAAKAAKEMSQGELLKTLREVKL